RQVLAEEHHDPERAAGQRQQHRERQVEPIGDRRQQADQRQKTGNAENRDGDFRHGSDVAERAVTRSSAKVSPEVLGGKEGPGRVAGQLMFQLLSPTSVPRISVQYSSRTSSSISTGWELWG